MDKFAIIKYPLTTEAAMKKIEDHNTLVFITDIKANKHQIKNAVKKVRCSFGFHKLYIWQIRPEAILYYLPFNTFTTGTPTVGHGSYPYGAGVPTGRRDSWLNIIL